MLEIGSVLQGRYEVMQPLGEGGMGAVYLARDQRLGNTVALKETFFSDATLLAAFEREARLLAGLRHVALPKVIDHFADNGQFLVMEYIPGEDLHDMLEACAELPPLADVLQWADQLLDALDYLHAQDPPIIHRDIKPQNLKLTSRNQIVLLDFGLAKGKATEMTWSETTSSIFGYTPSYAPLEQIQGSGTDARSDIYSLAATLYHLLTGQKPVDALTRASAVVNEQTDPLVPVSELNAKIQGAVSAVIMHGMALNKSQRLASAAEMRARLRDAARPVAAKTPPTILRTEVNASGGPAALRGASTNIMASAPATSAEKAEPTGSSAIRTANTGLRKAPPATPQASRLNRPQPRMIRQQRQATVEVASGGASNLSRVTAAGIILTAALTFVVFVFTRSVKREEERAGPAVMQKNDAPPASTSSSEPAQARTEERRGANASPQSAAASKPAGAEQRPASDEAPAKETPSADAASEAKSDEPARQQGRVPSMQEPEGTKPLPRQVEEEPRREPARQERPAPPQREGPPPEHVFPPPPFPPPGGMPPPGRRRP